MGLELMTPRSSQILIEPARRPSSMAFYIRLKPSTFWHRSWGDGSPSPMSVGRKEGDHPVRGRRLGHGQPLRNPSGGPEASVLPGLPPPPETPLLDRTPHGQSDCLLFSQTTLFFAFVALSTAPGCSCRWTGLTLQSTLPAHNRAYELRGVVWMDYVETSRWTQFCPQFAHLFEPANPILVDLWLCQKLNVPPKDYSFVFTEVYLKVISYILKAILKEKTNCFPLLQHL